MAEQGASAETGSERSGANGGAGRPRVVIAFPQRFYRDVIPALEADGIDVVAIIAGNLDPFRTVCRDARLIHQTDALLGEIGPGTPAAVDMARLAELAESEPTSLTLMDQYNSGRVSLLQLRSLYIRHVAVWDQLLTELDPDAVLFHDAPHRGFDHVLYQLCRLRGVPTLITDFTCVDDTVLLRRDVHVVPGEETFAAALASSASSAADAPAERDEEEDQAAREDPSFGFSSIYIGSISPVMHDIDRISRAFTTKRIVRRVLNRKLAHPFIRPPNRPRYAASPKRPTQLSVSLRQARALLHARLLLQRYEELASLEVTPRPYVFVPLQMQPEKSTVPYGKAAYDFLDVVRLVSEALPDGWDIVVKEHPAQFSKPLFTARGRDERYYRHLLEIPNVQLVPIGMDSLDLVAGSQAVVTITGTPAWEGVNIGRPGLIFGAAWYTHCPGVRHVASADDLRVAFDDIRAGRFVVDRDGVARFAKVLQDEVGFRGAFDDRFLAASPLTPAENTEGYRQALVPALFAARAARRSS